MKLIGTEIRLAEKSGAPCRTAAQMTEICCDDAPELICCEKVTNTAWSGYSRDEVLEHLGISLDASGRDAAGRLTEIRFKERTRPCGYAVNKYDLTPNNCCDEVAALSYDTDNSVDILAPDTSGLVRFTGGRLPALVTVRGNGFTLDGYNVREAWAYSRAFRVYANQYACGTAPITINDGCSVTAGSVRATVGRWDGVCVAWSNVADRYYTNYRPTYKILEGFDECGIPILTQVTNGEYKYCTTFTGSAVYWYGSTWYDYWSDLNYISIETFDAIYDHLSGLGWPNESANTYAPNGPGDIEALGLPLCAPSGQVCRFICG